MSSASVRSLGFDEELNILEIEFQDGTVYQFQPVPAKVYEELVNSDSVGRTYNQLVKGRFAYRRVE